VQTSTTLRSLVKISFEFPPFTFRHFHLNIEFRNSFNQIWNKKHCACHLRHCCTGDIRMYVHRAVGFVLFYDQANIEFDWSGECRAAVQAAMHRITQTERAPNLILVWSPKDINVHLCWGAAPAILIRATYSCIYSWALTLCSRPEGN